MTILQYKFKIIFSSNYNNSEGIIIIELNLSNIAEYLRARTELFTSEPIEVTELSSDFTGSENEGYVNYLFRARQNGMSYVLKQARTHLRCDAIASYLPAERNYLEYISFLLREEIAGFCVPKMLFLDKENHVFLMEDLSRNARIMRFQLNEGVEFMNFPRQIGDFLAKSHFYTSELYLDKKIFRDLQHKFHNPYMRAIMEDLVLMKSDVSLVENSRLKSITERFWKNAEIQLAVMHVRDNFIKKSECLIHGDLHTSNIFANLRDTKIIDMEYSFMAPYSYDLGYLLANFVSQYAAFTFREDFFREKRKDFQQYLLDTIERVFEVYFERFKIYFEKDAKPLYKNTKGYIDSLFLDILQDSLGVMAVANMMRIINLSLFPDFDCMDGKAGNTMDTKLSAFGLSLAIDKYLLLNRKEITSPIMAVNGIKKVQREFRGFV